MIKFQHSIAPLLHYSRIIASPRRQNTQRLLLHAKFDRAIANQLAILFDGLPQTPGGYESPTAAGDVGRCIK